MRWHWWVRLWKFALVDLRIYFRNASAVVWTFMVPVLLLVLIMVSFGDDQRSLGHLVMAVEDRDRSELSQAFTAELTAAVQRIHRLDVHVVDGASPDDRRTASAIVGVPARFADDVRAGRMPKVAILYDAHGPATVRLLTSVIINASERFALEHQRGADRSLPFVPEVDRFSGSSISFKAYVLNGTVAMLLYSMCLYGFAVPLVALREFGFLKMFSVFPIPQEQFLLAYFLTRLTLLISFSLIMLVAGGAVFDVNIAWQLSVLANYTVFLLVGGASFLALGLAIASYSKNIAQAVLISNIFYYPTIFISNLFIPDRNFPEWITIVASAFPLRAFADGLRRISIGHTDVIGEGDAVVFLVGFACLAGLALRRGYVWHANPFRTRRRRLFRPLRLAHRLTPTGADKDGNKAEA